MSIRPLPNRALGVILGLEERTTKAGIIIASDDGKDRGIRARWIYIHSVGSKVDWLKPGQYAYVEHGRWSRAMNYEGMKLVNIDLEAVLGVQDEEPDDDVVGESIDTKPDSVPAEAFGAGN
jgi:hypothetical protein